MGKLTGREMDIESILLRARPEPLDFPELAPAVRGVVDSDKDDTLARDVPSSPSHAVVRTVALVLVAAALAGLLVLSRHVAAQRAFDTVAFGDVLSVLKALDEVDDGTFLDLTMRGPGPVPGLPGAFVSEGSTLHVHHRHDETYVRGAHDRGSLIYRFDNGSLYASPD